MRKAKSLRPPKIIKSEGTVLLLLAVSLIFFVAFRLVEKTGSAGLQKEMLRAVRLMEDAQSALRACGSQHGFPLDGKNDPNRTGLIGIEASPITTTLGNPAAKRTAANPEFAALLVLLLDEAGLRRGDCVAIGASGSFPALIVASLAAARALDLRPLVIGSLAASQWGANRPEFTALEMFDCLNAAEVFDVRPLALSIGGEGDSGEDLSAGGRKLIEDKIRAGGLRLIKDPRLSANVRERIGLYEKQAGASPIRAFINIGGNWANIGEDSGILELRPGLVRKPLRPAPGRQGVIQEMLLRGVPVIHLLNIKGLCERYGLAWDPVPLPKKADDAAIVFRASGPGVWKAVLIASYLALLALIMVVRKRGDPAKSISKNEAQKGPAI